MRVAFTKMNGAGNDFILIDNRDRKLKLTRAQVARLCHRQRGIGADGVLLLVPCKSRQAEWAWQFYNSDGSQADMCGNGARCFARFAKTVVGIDGGVTFETGAGVITAVFDGDRVTISLTSPKNEALGEEIETSQGETIVHSINTGVPHTVIFVPDADRAMVLEQGREIRQHAHFGPKGTNVNFVQVIGPNHIRVRTYERGVEGETLACGTGVTASALVAARVEGFTSPVSVEVQGGDTLVVSFTETLGHFSDVRLAGPAEFVFEGTIEV
jgi:diaminopimelate epimerase